MTEYVCKNCGAEFKKTIGAAAHEDATGHVTIDNELIQND